MKKIIMLILLLSMFANLKVKAETAREFIDRCSSYGGSIQRIPIVYKGCTGIQLVCALTNGNYVSLNYGPLVSKNAVDCFVLDISIAATNLSDPDFWKSIDLQTIKHLTNHGYLPGNCADTANASTPNIYKYFQFNRRLCNKIVFDSNLGTDRLELCPGTSTCFTMFSACYDTDGTLITIKLISRTEGPSDCGTINLSMHPTSNVGIYESDCFSVGCY